MPDIAALLPAGPGFALGPGTALLMVLLSAFTALLTAGLGLGGGVLLLAGMAFLVPPAALIPLHGVVQIGANAGRTWLLRRYTDGTILLPFAIGALAGTLAGGGLALELPPHWLDLALALFILWAAWGRWPALRGRAERAGLWAGGLGISFLSMFVGATGPLVASLMKSRAMDRQRHMATFSACMTLQHGLKILAFGFFGFQFAPWLPLLAAMVASGFIGTWLGERWLAGRSDAGFQRVLAWLLTAMALQLLWQASAPFR